MIIDELVVHNFGIYIGRQIITLTPVASNKPIILFGGMNGGGKTTLVDAILLCLFGAFSKCSNRGNLSYTDFLENSICKASKVREAAVELAFRHFIDGKEEHYRLHRSWKTSTSGCREVFEVIRNGRMERNLTENWINQVEEIIPINIAHLFLFDGDKIEAFATPESSRDLIGTAIQNLLGLNIVDQLDRDLQIFERRKQQNVKNESEQKEIEVAELSLKELCIKKDKLKQEKASIITHRINRAGNQLKELEADYKKLGGDLYDKRIDIEKRKKDADEQFNEIEIRLREIAADAAPFLLIRNLLQKIQIRDREEATTKLNRDIIDTLNNRDRALLEHLNNMDIPSHVVSVIDSYFRNDLERRSILSNKIISLNLTVGGRNDLNMLLHNRLTEIELEINKESNSHAEMLGIVSAIDIEFASIPELDVLSNLICERDTIKSEMDRAIQALNKIDEEIRLAEREIERKQQALNRLLESEARTKFRTDDNLRLLSHLNRARDTLRQFKSLVIARHVQRIERLILDSCHLLLSKTVLISNLKIGIPDFTITLFDQNGKEITQDRLSAGERQLLAISTLWGLAKVSGRPIPTAIDTPMGRLDTAHRSRLVERYFPFASHQVILFSTDEEVVGEYYDKIRPWVGREYLLSYNGDMNVTTIVPGYFSKEE